MKASEILAFVAGAAAATGVTLLITTEKGADLRHKVSSKMSKEEIDKLIAKLKRQREEAPSEEESLLENLIDEIDDAEIPE